MKILYISQGIDPDYTKDMLFHGLRSIEGPDVVDIRRIWNMYRSSFDKGNYNSKELARRWFTVYGLLPDDKDVDRSDILRKIEMKYFDYIIYGSANRYRPWEYEIQQLGYPQRQVIYVDGEDDDRVFHRNGSLYFKREATTRRNDCIPIQFGIPKEKIITFTPTKKYLMAPSDPRNPSSRVYETEEDYYAQYAESYFGYTCKRGGWDCVRHYEIMASGALPYFEGLENCPPNTMVDLPKAELLQARSLHDQWTGSGEDLSRWMALMQMVRGNLHNALTTEAMAIKFLDRVNKEVHL